MLIETKAVVQMALLFGSTWIVNSIVFCAVLVMILVANLFVLRVRPRSLAPYYVGLLLSLVASAVIPLDAFLGLSREWQIAGSCLLAFTPVLFAGVVFAVSFSRRRRSGSRVRREHRGRDGRRTVRVQLDAARLPVPRPRRAGVLRPVRAWCPAGPRDRRSGGA